MKNNPLNGYQPDYDVVTTADAQEHEIEHAKKTVANAAETPATGGGRAVPTDTQRSRDRRAKNDFYNLTVEIPRNVAERVFAPDALRKLGYLSVSDCVRHAVAALDERLSTITAKEKAADAGTSDGKAD